MHSICGVPSGFFHFTSTRMEFAAKEHKEHKEPKG